MTATKTEVKKEGPIRIEQKVQGCSCGGNPITASKGELVINVVRESFNVQADLPYCIFGTLYIGTRFGNVLTSYLFGVSTANGPVTVTAAIVNNAIQFTYSDTVETDIITVSSPSISLISYLEALENINQNIMKTNYVLFDCNAGSGAPTLDNTSIYTLKSGGLFLQKSGGEGDKQQHLIIPQPRTTTGSTQINLVDLYMNNEPVKPDTVWVHQFKYLAPAAFGGAAARIQFDYTVFISERVNLNKEEIKLV